MKAVYQARAAAQGRSHVYGLCHLLHVRARFERGLCIGVYAVRTLQGMRDRKPNQSLLAPRERPVLLTGLIPCHKLLKEVWAMLAHFRETSEVFFFII